MQQHSDLLPTFFCIPDITGFTRLITTADVAFSNEVVPSLLRKMIDCNYLDMSVGEIEGDAVFFYRTGKLPSVNSVIKQCTLFYQCFQRYIKSIEQSDPDNYKAHLANGQLGLKIIIHYGNISTSNIKGRVKLIGEDVIIAHRLLKNSIIHNEYILFTNHYLQHIKATALHKLITWDKLKYGSENFDFIGEISYQYCSPPPLSSASLH